MPDRPSKLDAYAERLSAWLRTEANRPRKQKRTIKQLHADLMSLGYEDSYGRVAAFARPWKVDRQGEMHTSGRGTFVPLAFEPSEAFQFDWSEDWAVIGGERTKLQVAHTKLSYSRAFMCGLTALGVQAVEHHRKRVRFFSTVELVNALEQEKAQSKAGQIANRLAHSDLVILDELGYLPFSASGGRCYSIC